MESNTHFSDNIDIKGLIPVDKDDKIVTNSSPMEDKGRPPEIISSLLGSNTSFKNINSRNTCGLDATTKSENDGDPSSEDSGYSNSKMDAEASASTSSETVHHPAIDGGYGWVVVLASFFNAFVIDGVSSSFGLLFPHIMAKYGTGALLTSFAGSLFVSYLIMGSLAAGLVTRFGVRKVSMVGGVLSCLSIILSAVCPHIILFILTYGLLTGCACGLVFLPSVIIVNEYFHQKRGIANGIITSGSGAGLLVLAPFINFLLDRFTLEGTVLILGGVMLNMTVFSSLYRPMRDYSFGILQKLAVESDNSESSAESDETDSVIEDEAASKMEASNTNVFDYNEMLNDRDKGLVMTPTLPPISENRNGQVEELDAVKTNKLILENGVSKKSLSKRTVQEMAKVQKAIGKSLWKSEHQLQTMKYSGSIGPFHKSLQNLPSSRPHEWESNDEEAQEFKKLRYRRQNSDHHHQHNRHQRPHPPRDFLTQTRDFVHSHASELYLAGSVSTLISLHNKYHGQTMEIEAKSPQEYSLTRHSSRSKKSIMDSTSLYLSNEGFPISCQNDEGPAWPASTVSLNIKAKLRHIAPSVSYQNFSKTPTGGSKASDINITDDLKIVGISEVPNLNIIPSKGNDSTLIEQPFILGGSLADVMMTTPSSTTRQLLSNHCFQLFCLAASLIQVGYPIAGMFLADHAYRLGFQPHHSALLMILMGSCNIVGRLLSGCLATVCLTPLALNNLSLLLGAAICFACPFYDEFWSLALLASLYGFSLGFFPPLQPLILVEYFGLGSLGPAFGTLTTIKGIASILGPPLAGWISDASGDYSMAFVFAGAAFFLSSLVHFLMPLASRREKT